MKRAITYMCLLMAALSVVMAARSLGPLDEDAFLGAVPYPWVFALSALAWAGTAVVVWALAAREVRWIVVSTAIATTVVAVSAYGTDTLMLVLGAAVIIVVGIDDAVHHSGHRDGA